MIPDTKIAILRTMVRIRRLEQTALREYSMGSMGGWLLLSTGQESIAATVRAAMTADDHSISGFRGLGHAIAAGISMRSVLAELMGRSAGCSGGKGGMLSFYDPSRNHWGCHGLAASQTPLANGLAFGSKQQSKPGAVVCFMGAGATNRGAFHETLNLAGLFDLPVVFVIENNGFDMFTSQKESSRFTQCLARRAETYGIDWDFCGDGDIPILHSKITTALERARTQHRPTVLEVSTMRYYGWSVSDANTNKYRTRESITERKENFDPLTLWQQHLINEGVLSATEAQQITNAAKSEAKDALAYAALSPPPASCTITDHVYWETDHNTTASKTGRHFFS